jgi:hypothetical protein
MTDRIQAELERDKKALKRREEAREEAIEHDKLDDALDRGLKESFPGSDPVSVTQPPASTYDKYENGSGKQKR